MKSMICALMMMAGLDAHADESKFAQAASAAASGASAVVKRTGAAVGRGVEKAGAAIERGAKATGEVVRTGVAKTGAVLKRGGEKLQEAAGGASSPK